jgi:putative transposase
VRNAKKSSGLLCEKPEVKFEFIRNHPEHPVTKWAAMLCVSASGYYDWLRAQPERERREKTLTEAIKEIFENSNGTYGVARICGVLRNKGCKASYKRVQNITEAQGLVSIHRRRLQRSLTDSRKARDDGYINHVRDLNITEPFQVITSDISYIRTSQGFEYLCTIKDVASGITLAHTMADNMKSDLVVQTIKKAARNWDLPEGCIFHSDRGSQYTAEAVRSLLNKKSIIQSFSRVGKPGDNSWSESFFANLKKEAVHWRHFPTRSEARQAILAYIEAFYNTRRVQKRLGYLTPIEWLNHYTKTNLMSVA